MKIILIVSLLTCTQVLAGTTLYKFSGKYVYSEAPDLPEKISASEVLDLTDAISFSFPDFYFSTNGTYGSTNWTRFPDSEYSVGSEVTLGVEKRNEKMLYLFPFEYEYRFMLDWDNVRKKPHFVREGGTLTVGQYMPINKPFILSGSRQIGSREWIIFHIEELSTHVMWSDATTDQKRPILTLFDSLKTNDKEGFISVWSKTELEGVSDWSSEQMLEFVKEDIQNTFGSIDINLDKLETLYTGGTDQGIVKLILADKVKFYDVVEEDGIWKVGK